MEVKEAEQERNEERTGERMMKKFWDGEEEEMNKEERKIRDEQRERGRRKEG